MFDSGRVKRYELLHGDANDVLSTLKPRSIDSVYATPTSHPVLHEHCHPTVDLEAYMERFFRLLHDVLKDDGSLFVTLPEDSALHRIVCSIGWIRQHDVPFPCHYVKSNGYYSTVERGFPGRPTDYEAVCPDDNGSFWSHDMVCNFFTPPGGVTLDPTVGKGTHVLAALLRGKHAIGIDRDADSLLRAEKRIDGMFGQNRQ